MKSKYYAYWSEYATFNKNSNNSTSIFDLIDIDSKSVYKARKY